MKGAGELKRLVLPSTRRQWEQTYIDHLNQRILLLCGIQRARVPPRHHEQHLKCTSLQTDSWLSHRNKASCRFARERGKVHRDASRQKKISHCYFKPTKLHKAAGMKTKQNVKQRLQRLLIRCSLCWGRRPPPPRCRAMDRRWNRKTVSLVSWVMTVVRLPIFWTSSSH